MKRHSMMTRSKRTFVSVTRNKEGEPCIAERTERVSVCDLYTTGKRKDNRVFWRGARVA